MWEKEENDAVDHKCESLEFLIKSFTALNRRPANSDSEEGMVAGGLSMRGHSCIRLVGPNSRDSVNPAVGGSQTLLVL